MSFQEKSRWIALTANLIVWGWYFVTVAGLLATGMPDERLGGKSAFSAVEEALARQDPP